MYRKDWKPFGHDHEGKKHRDSQLSVPIPLGDTLRITEVKEVSEAGRSRGRFWLVVGRK